MSEVENNKEEHEVTKIISKRGMMVSMVSMIKRMVLIGLKMVQ